MALEVGSDTGRNVSCASAAEEDLEESCGDGPAMRRCARGGIGSSQATTPNFKKRPLHRGPGETSLSGLKGKAGRKCPSPLLRWDKVWLVGIVDESGWCPGPRKG